MSFFTGISTFFSKGSQNGSNPAASTNGQLGQNPVSKNSPSQEKPIDPRLVNAAIHTAPLGQPEKKPINPKIVNAAIDWLKMEADLSTEGLFRVSGSIANGKKLLNLAENGITPNFSDYSTHDVVGFVKKQSQGNILPNHCGKQFFMEFTQKIGAIPLDKNTQEFNEIIENLTRLLKLNDTEILPEFNTIPEIIDFAEKNLPKDLPKHILDRFIRKVKNLPLDRSTQEFQEVIKDLRNILQHQSESAKNYLLLLNRTSMYSIQNKMDIENLAIVMNLAITPDQTLAKNTTVANFLIKQAEDICQPSIHQKSESSDDKGKEPLQSEGSSSNSSSPASSDDESVKMPEQKEENPFARIKNLQIPLSKRLYLLRLNIQDPHSKLTAEEKEKEQNLYNELLIGADDKFQRELREIKQLLQMNAQLFPNQNQNRDYTLEALEQIAVTDSKRNVKNASIPIDQHLECKALYEEITRAVIQGKNYNYMQKPLFSTDEETEQTLPEDIGANLFWLIKNIGTSVDWQNMLVQGHDKDIPCLQYLEKKFDLNLIIKYLLPFIVDIKIVAALGDKGGTVQAMALLFLTRAKEKFIEQAPAEKRESIEMEWAEFFNRLRSRAV